MCEERKLNVGIKEDWERNYEGRSGLKWRRMCKEEIEGRCRKNENM